MKNIKVIFGYLKKYKWSIILCSVVIFFTNMSYIFTGYLNGLAIERVTQGALKAALMALGTYFGLCFVSDIVGRTAFYFLAKTQIKIAREILYNTYLKVTKMPAVAFEDMSSGEIINRLSMDTETIVGSFSQILSILSSLVSTVIILIYIFFNSYIIGLQILLFLIIYAFVVKKYTKKFKDANEESKKANDGVSSLVGETVRGIREIKTLGISNNLYTDLKNNIKRLYNRNIYEYKMGFNYDLIANSLKILLECSCFATCAYLSFKGSITITFFVAMTYYIYRYTWAIENVTEFSKTYERLNVSLGRVNDILLNKLYEDDKFGDYNPSKIEGIININNLKFNYKNEDTVIKGLNVEFKPNKKIALVGPSGEGKSTIFNLLTRLFEPVSGTIFIDGVNIKEYSEKALRKHISIIRQDPFIFNKTIKDNFKLIDPSVTLKEIKKYCALAHIDKYIESLPKGYNTLLGEGGVNLSGGQKQRVAIARTLLKKSKIILFDEATSALDNESQNYIKKAIDNLVKDHTVIIVAHRLSTIIDADEIYVIKGGRVIATGTHEELIKTCKFYKKLYFAEDNASKLII